MAKSINIGIINSGIANIASVVNMLKKIGFSSEIINNANEYEENISHIIIPGIGSYDQGIKNIKNKSFDSIIYKHIESEKPILGICLGMQLLGIGSEEGLLDGFKIINQKCIKFNLNEDYAIPHMGWNYVYPKKDSLLFKNIDDPKFYFVHSYYFPRDTEYLSSVCKYSIDFCASFEKNNVFGVQFHPEKSHFFGFSLLKNFVEFT